jgi:hypothetical protein
MKLYMVNLRGMRSSAIGTAYGVSYVVAEDTVQAYSKVKKFLDKENIGFKSDRGLESIELLADEYQYAEVNKMLFL